MGSYQGLCGYRAYGFVPQWQAVSEEAVRASLKLAAEHIEWYNRDAEDAIRVCKPAPKKKAKSNAGEAS